MSNLKMTAKEFRRVTKRDFDNGAVRNEITNALIDREKLLDFIQQWTGHSDDCAALDEGSPRIDCTCGYDKARDEILAKATE